MHAYFRLSLAAALLGSAACEGPSVQDVASPSVHLQAMEQQDTFNPLPRGFEWSVAERFPKDLNGDGVRDFRYDEAYLRPESFDVTLDGCPQYDSGYTYVWHVKGERFAGDTWQVTYPDRGCRFPSVFPGQGTYQVTLTVHGPSGVSRPYAQKVALRDWLIVGMGDSYASGEGNPDIPADYDNDQDPVWADRRCHRSFKAASALVAQQLEESDPHTTVTYVSLACSGATINRESYTENLNPLDTLDPDPGAHPRFPVGSGMLGAYRGIENPQGEAHLPAQVDQLKALVGTRLIDAVLLSAGGNDAGFGDVLKHCTIRSTCHAQSDGAELTAYTNRYMNALPDRFAALGDRMNTLFPGTRVYLTEYPDLSRDQNGETCFEILHNVSDLADGIRRSQGETQWIQANFLTPLNQHLSQAVQTQRALGRPWRLVGGVEASFRNHGMCAGDARWFRIPPESRDLQGPEGDKTGTKGTAHPNEAGHRDYARLIRASLRTRLGTHPYYPDDTLLRDTGTGAIYVTQGFGRFQVPPDGHAHLLSRLGKSDADIKNLTSEQMAAVPTVPRDGTFLLEGTGAVFVVYGGAAYPIVDTSADLPRLLEAHGVDESALGAVPTGASWSPGLTPVPRDGTVLQRDTGIYYMHRRAMVWVTDMQQLHELGISPGHVRPLPAFINPPTQPDGGTLTPLRLRPRDRAFVTDGQRISLMAGDAAFWIPTPAEHNQLRWLQSRPNAPAQALPTGAHALLPTRPHDNLLMRRLSGGPLQIVQGGTAFPVNNPNDLPRLIAYSPPFDTAVHMLPSVPAGTPDALAAAPLNHTLLREVDADEVYVMLAGARYHMASYEEIRRTGLDPARIRLVPPGTLSRFPVGGVRLDGNVDDIIDGVVRGWGLDLDSATNPLQVHFYVDGPAGTGQFAGQVNTVHARPDVNAAYNGYQAAGTHGFFFPMPDRYRDGRLHTVHAYVLDAQDQHNRMIGSRTFQLAPR